MTALLPIKVTLPPPRGHDPYQEVTEVPTIEGDLKLLSEQLKMPHLIYVPSFSATFGNAILSRYPFITSTTSILKNAKDVETRGMIAVEVDVGGMFSLTLSSTHSLPLFSLLSMSSHCSSPPPPTTKIQQGQTGMARRRAGVHVFK